MNPTDNTWINATTGEIREFKPRTPKQQKTAAEFAEQNSRKRELYEFIAETYGRFFFCKYDEILEATKDNTATAFRFLYLCTFADGDTYEIICNGRKMSQITDFTVAFRTSEITTNKFINDMLQCDLIYLNNNKHYAVNEELFAMKLRRNDFAQQSTRTFCNAIRELYENSFPREHKLLGSLVRLLPFVNVYTNVLCWNVEEWNPEDIHLLTMEEIAQVLYPNSVAYGEKKIRDLFKTTVKEEPVLLKVKSPDVTQFYLNPRLFNRVDDVDKMYVLFHQFDVAKYNKGKEMAKCRKEKKC